MPLYRQGTVSLTQGSRQIIGVGTEFGVKTSPGDILVLLQGNQVHHFYEFKSIESDTEATLDIEAHDTVTNSEFVILRSVSTANNLYLMRKIDEFLKDRQITLNEWRDWLQGTTDGGPEGDGRYPMTDRYGVTTLVPSPMALQRDLVESLTDVQDLLDSLQNLESFVIQATEARDDAVAAAASVLDLELETESYKDAAEAAASAAEGYQTVVEGYATAAANSASDAQGYLNTVADHAQAAAESETNAAASELEASISEANAQASATLASTKADEASGFADDAGTFALDSAASADAAGMSATAALTSEMNAAASASQSHTSAQESATSAGESAASAADALSSQVAAAASATQAQTSAGEASGYADDAAASAAAAATSEANAAASLTLAEAAASEAQTHRNAASTSANEAEAAKNAAQGWAANAAASASGISAYVDDAFSHAQSAQTSAQAAQDYADNAQGYSQEAGQRAQEAQTHRDYAEQSAQNAYESEQKAQAWANQMDYPVEDGEYSARHWASQAKAIVGGHAVGIGFTPTDTLESTNVQDAIEEVATRSSVSEDPGNTLEQREDGLYVEVPEIDLSDFEQAITNLQLDPSETADFIAQAGKKYWAQDSYVITLPSSPNLGDFVTFSKSVTATPTIEASAGTFIVTEKGSTTSILFDINAEITFVFNGTDWEL